MEMMDFFEKDNVLSENNYYRIIERHGEEYICFRSCKDPTMRNLVYAELTNSIDYNIIVEYHNLYTTAMLSDYYFALYKDTSELRYTVEEAEAEGRSKEFALAANELYNYLEKIAHDIEKGFKSRLDKGTLSMSDLPRYFKAGSEVIVDLEKCSIGGTVMTSQVIWEWTGPQIAIRMHVIHAIKGAPAIDIYNYVLPGFMGTKEVKTLPVRMISNEEKIKLTERGKKVLGLSKPGTYASYTGIVLQQSWWMPRGFRGDGRVVIDPISFARLESNIWNNAVRASGITFKNSREEITDKTLDVKPSDHWRCYPYLFGFSLAAKQWGRLEAEGISPISFREDAFDKLVLEQESKDLIYSLVKYHGGGFTDIIEGKGGGCIFLLHGEPGLGKTASAEAVAEILHKPLYSVSVGELGTNIENLESSLRDILEVATIWDAVILLDEADIFLEARDEHDIERNAMVGVFLRLLEYHNGVLFLTTNRVKNIDKAFYSRISVALHYTDNSEEKRGKIWTNLLEAAKMNATWASTMKVYDVNGRQIKNAIRLAQTLARADGNREPQEIDLRRAINVALQFTEDMIKSRAEVPKVAETQNHGSWGQKEHSS